MRLHGSLHDLQGPQAAADCVQMNKRFYITQSDAGRMRLLPWLWLLLRVAADSSPLLLQRNVLLAEKHGLNDLAGKSVYLVMIDRFSREGGKSSDDSRACEGHHWCNGTIKGITEHLDYISAMGWDCIWVTPVIKNFYGPDLGDSGFGYHGYWAENFYEIDPNFGTKDDLKELVQQTHKHGPLARYSFMQERSSSLLVGRGF